jgi:peptidoglycan L-alanyl-D-glutamate endopeptidase CwlK
MFKFSETSQEKKGTCEQDLQDLFDAVIEGYDCIVLDGHRSVKEQQKKYEQGTSKVKYSKHNLEPSKAIDVSPYPIPENWGKISWGLIPKEYHEELKKQFKERAKFYHFAGYVKGVANRMNIDIVGGHDWDSDNDFNDQTFDDLIHFQTK